MFMISTVECRADDALCCQPPVAGRAGGGQGQARVRTPAPALARDSLQRTTADINLNILNFSSSASSHNSAHGGSSGQLSSGPEQCGASLLAAGQSSPVLAGSLF